MERTCRYARRFTGALTVAGYQVLNEVVLNQVLVSFGTPEVTQRVIGEIQTDGTCWCGGIVGHDRRGRGTEYRIDIAVAHAISGTGMRAHPQAGHIERKRPAGKRPS